MDLPAELFELFCYVHYVELAESPNSSCCISCQF